MFLPIFTGCEKEKIYNLSNFDAYYLQAVAGHENLWLNQGKFEISYSRHSRLNQAIVTDKIDPYVSLTDFEYILKSSLAFAENYISVCSNANFEVQEKDYLELRNDIANFASSLNDLDYNIDLLGNETQNLVSDEDLLSTNCLARLKIVYQSYINCVESATSLSGHLSNVYFNVALSNGKVDYYLQGENNFSVSQFVTGLHAKQKMQISNLTELFVEKILSGTGIATDLTTQNQGEFYKLGNSFTKFKTDVEAINKDIDIAIGETKVVTAVHKKALFELAVEMFNVEQTMDEGYSNFVLARKNVNYATKKNDVNATSFELACVKTIDSRDHLVLKCNTILTEIFEILENY